MTQNFYHTLLPKTVSAVWNANILWVDDIPENIATEINDIEQAGARKITVVTSTEAAIEVLQKAQDRKYDVVISDMNRPPDRQAGYTLLEKLREQHLILPFIIYASENFQAYKIEAKKRGAIGSTNNFSELFELLTLAILQKSEPQVVRYSYLFMLGNLDRPSTESRLGPILKRISSLPNYGAGALLYDAYGYSFSTEIVQKTSDIIEITKYFENDLIEKWTVSAAFDWKNALDHLERGFRHPIFYKSTERNIWKKCRGFDEILIMLNKRWTYTASSWLKDEYVQSNPIALIGLELRRLRNSHRLD